MKFPYILHKSSSLNPTVSYVYILPRVLVTIDGVLMGNLFIDYVQVVTTTKYNTLADSYTTNRSTRNFLCAFTSLHYPFPSNGFITVSL
jgi:hypothetical protein